MTCMMLFFALAFALSCFGAGELEEIASALATMKPLFRLPLLCGGDFLLTEPMVAFTK